MAAKAEVLGTREALFVMVLLRAATVFEEQDTTSRIESNCVKIQCQYFVIFRIFLS